LTCQMNSRSLWAPYPSSFSCKVQERAFPELPLST
jgi:hypothetical protein